VCDGKTLKLHDDHDEIHQLRSTFVKIAESHPKIGRSNNPPIFLKKKVSVKEEIYNIDHVTVFSFLIFFKENRKKSCRFRWGFFMNGNLFPAGQRGHDPR
jgi:hypothetical protein